MKRTLGPLHIALKPSSGFSLVELLAAVAITTLGTATVLPVLVSASDTARQSACLSNEKQIGLALMQYAQDNDGVLMMQKYRASPAQVPTVIPMSTPNVAPVPAPNMAPVPAPKWMDLVLPYVKAEAVFTCPDASPADATARYRALAKRAKARRYGTYGLNGAYYKGSGVAGVNATGVINTFQGTALSRIAVPASTVLATEMRTGTPYSGPPDNATIDWANVAQNPVPGPPADPPTLVAGGQVAPIVILRHSGGVNVVWCDGHAAWMAGTALAATHRVKGTPVAYLWTVEDD